jgi:hypothetical protein
MRGFGWIFTVLVVAGCGGGEAIGGAKANTEPGLHIEADQVVFRTGEFTVPSGEERYLCFPADVGETFKVDRFSYSSTTTVHHFLFARTLAPEPEGFTECDVLFKPTWEVVFAAGVGDSDLTLPDGAAQEFEQGDQMLVQLHLLNTSGQGVTERAEIVMRRTHAADTAPVLISAFGTSKIKLPPKQLSSVEKTCEVGRDAEVIALFPHMHQIGTKATLEVGESEETLELVYERDPYGFDQQTIEPFALMLTKGQTVRVTCSYDNPYDHEVGYGESSNDEMCFMITFSKGTRAGCASSGGGMVSEECLNVMANEIGIGGACTASGGECAEGLLCTADQGGGAQGMCISIGCTSNTECGENATCCTPSQGGGVINICIPEVCRPSDCETL